MTDTPGPQLEASQPPPLKPQAADAPAADLQGDPKDGMGLCLSGGGYRAMLYHCGTLIRMNEMGLLPRLTEVSAVSGGSITAGRLAVAWPDLEFGPAGVATNLRERVIDPVLKLARVGIDVKAVLEGDLVPGQTPAKILAHEYDKQLFGGANLGDLPGSNPRFTFFATNLQTGRAWAFDANEALDARVGVIEKPADRPFFTLAQVVAASSAFPPLLSPVRIDLSAYTVKPLPWCDMTYPPYTREAVLTDGGIYDNLASERVMRHCRTMLVSNAGADLPNVASPGANPITQDLRVAAILDQRAEDERLARLQMMDRYGERKLAYWSIHKQVGEYGLADPLPFSAAETAAAAAIRTRLDPFSEAEITLLLRAGYAGADAGLRASGLVPDAKPGNVGNLPLAGRDETADGQSSILGQALPLRQWLQRTQGPAA